MLGSIRERLFPGHRFYMGIPLSFFFFESPPSELKSNSNMIPDGYRSMRSNPRMKSLLSNFPSFRVIL